MKAFYDQERQQKVSMYMRDERWQRENWVMTWKVLTWMLGGGQVINDFNIQRVTRKEISN